jgi:hypothetical protein
MTPFFKFALGIFLGMFLLFTVAVVLIVVHAP